MKEWKNDPAHSRPGFTIRHLTISEINGRFSEMDVVMKTDKPDFSDASFSATIKAQSIDTEVAARDKHLRTSDFFDVETYPEITFKSTGISGMESGKGQLTGDLTIRGVTKPITLDMTCLGSVTNPMNNEETAGFQFQGKVKRSDFGVGPKFPEMIVSDTVNLIINAEFSPVKA